MSDSLPMPIKALAPWFGGKRTLAPRIVAELGKHTQYFEPFCGGMSILLQKERSQKETVSDLHGDLTNLARVVSRLGLAEMLYSRLVGTIMAEGLLDEARRELESEPAPSSEDEEPRLERAYWYFIASWMGRNGTAGTDRLDYQIAVRWTKGGGSPTVRFQNAVESLPAWHRRLLNVVILQRDAFDIIDRFEDDQGTAIYADPPYPAETRSSISDGGARADSGGGRYLHEFSHGTAGGLFGAEDDHARLARVLRAYKRARIVVSTYDCPRYRDLFTGWTFVPCPMAKLLHAQNGRGARKQEAPECLIINGPSYTGGAE